MTRTEYLNRIKEARTRFLDRGSLPEGVLHEPILRSWTRCANTGLSVSLQPQLEPITSQALEDLREQNSRLVSQARPEMENLQTQIIGTQGIVVLTDAAGTILHALGDPTFLTKAQRVALQPGVSWREENTGTNAIGTAIVEKDSVFVTGGEHYFEQNAFLGCSASPILDPYGEILGVLDVSGDYRQTQEHTMALVRMSAQMIENRMFSVMFAKDITLHFHTRPEFISTLWEGIAVFSPDGKLLAVNSSGLLQLGLNNAKYKDMDFNHVFEGSLPALLDVAKRTLPHSVPLVTQGGHRLYIKVEPGFNKLEIKGWRSIEERSANEFQPDLHMLDVLDTGDLQMQKVITSVKKVLGREIPILIEGETGTGKELLAKAIHSAGRRGKGPFVAINCASIPEGLIEAELFGYEEGAFTGAKRKGVQGKILQANGGTLFLDEIGEMPHQLQARLLRVLQEREIIPLGSGKGIPVDIALVSATNRTLHEHVARGLFREDLYYRLNGLRVTLPSLRDRSDLEILAERILQEESEASVTLHKETIQLLQRHPWRGNIRQLRNVLRVALAFLDSANEIKISHLPEDFVREFGGNMSGSAQNESTLGNSLEGAESALIRQTLLGHDGNITAAAKQLGISRATLYRKVQKLKQV